jgi:hypothetical protein
MQGDRLQISEASVRMNKSFRLSPSMVQTLTTRFGLATNGEEFRFMKLQFQDDRALFDLSAVLSVMPPSRNQLHQVLQVFRSLACTEIN